MLGTSLNIGLTQVLSDGENDYLYGAGRIGQQSASGWAYHLADALSSVRQVADAAASVPRSSSHEPFGAGLLSAGAAATSYGFAGEWADLTGLIHLRARSYDPITGRFLQHDPLRGYRNLPQTMNPYVYVINNPIMHTDPSGKLTPYWSAPNERIFLYICS